MAKVSAECSSPALLFKLAKTALSSEPEAGSATEATEPRMPPRIDTEQRCETSASSMTAPRPLGCRQSSASTTLPRARGQSVGPMVNAVVPRTSEWRRYLTVEERQTVREKIRAAYRNQCGTYEDLLSTVTAIDEELLHISAPSRLDYFKSGCCFEKRLSEKRKQLPQSRRESSREGSGTAEIKEDDNCAKRLRVDA